jgi:hypothetical protein
MVIAVTAMPVTTHAFSTNDFTIKSFIADYDLSRDERKHSHLAVTEKITAEFPNFDQNHGIERAIPQVYDGHSVHVKINTVTNIDGQDITYETNTVNHNTVLRIGDADTYVHGLQTYIISYSMQDVTKNFADHDEIFWNTNGTQWSQPFESLTARLHMDKTVSAAFGAGMRCVSGAYGATEQCAAVTSEEDGRKTFTFTANRMLQPGENLSFVASYNKDTFAAYTPTTWERIFPTLRTVWLIFNGAALLVVTAYAVRLWHRYGRPVKGKGTIVPEYVPPKNVSVLVAGTIVKQAPPTTAQIIDFAVRHYIKIYEIEARKIFGKKRIYELELVKQPTDLRPEEVTFMELLFGPSAATGTRINTDELGKKLQAPLYTFLASVGKQAVTDGLYVDRGPEKKHYTKHIVWTLLASLVLLSPGLFIGGIILLTTVVSLKPLSETGVELRDYLKGLLMYMKMAEADRLQALQSPEGAEKLPAGTDPTDTRQLVKLYERLLPFAILYGIEKDWVKQFASLYDQAPDWYAGNWTAFNAGVFASSISSFNSVSSTSFAPPSSSSSSGFSGGSGGGGGGGGGGGW